MRDCEMHENKPDGHGSSFTNHVLLLTCSLLLCDSHAARSLTCTRIGVCALAANREPSAVPQPAIAADIHQPFDVHLNLLAQVTFDPALLVYHGANLVDFFFCQLTNAFIYTDARFP